MQRVCIHLLFGLLLLARADCATYITEAYIATQITRGCTNRQKFFCKAIGWLVMPGRPTDGGQPNEYSLPA